VFGQQCSMYRDLLQSFKHTAGNAEATQQYADLMWRAGSPQGYRPPDISASQDFHTAREAPVFRQQDVSTSYGQRQSLLSPFQSRSRLDMSSQAASRSCGEHSRAGPSKQFLGAESHSADSTRPGTPPTRAAPISNNRFADPEFGYQQLLEPLLPISDLPQSTGHAMAQQSAQDQEASRPDQPFRTRSFPIVPFVPAPTSPLQRPSSHHSHSPQPSEPSHGTLQGLHMPLEPHERQLLNNLLHRSHSSRSQDRGSDHSQSSTSTHHDGQPLSLPRTWGSRRLTTGSLLMHDTSNLQEPHDLSR